eukprot:m.1011185 g.1011185  ORF g.1011185 m.1011185 type:complete len:95 (+) comp24061_c0_seq46:3221-3505(+)
MLLTNNKGCTLCADAPECTGFQLFDHEKQVTGEYFVNGRGKNAVVGLNLQAAASVESSAAQEYRSPGLYSLSPTRPTLGSMVYWHCGEKYTSGL